MRITRRRFVGSLGTASALRHGADDVATHWEAVRTFRGEELAQVAFPLGGIGTGTVSLGGYGNLRDWEIFNRPGKNTFLPCTFVALRVAGGTLAQPVARLIEREWLPPFTGSHGIARERGAGLPRFPEVTFKGFYPFAHLQFEAPDFPVEVCLEAFNPMVPHDYEASSLPVATFTYHFRSRSSSPLELCVAFSLMNPIGWDGVAELQHRRAPFFGQNVNLFRREGDAGGLLLTSAKYGPDNFRFGSLALITSAEDLSYRLRWEHGALWDELRLWWREFTEFGRMPCNVCPPSQEGETEYATLASHLRLAAGESKSVTFILAWHFPNIEDYWTGKKPYFLAQRVDPTRRLQNDYGLRWGSAWEAAMFTWRGLASLHERSFRFCSALFDSTLPAEVIDAVSSQLSTIRTNTLMVLAGKVPLGFEGCGDTEGCCPFNCTHVYNYEQAIPHLYPELARRMRELDFLVNLREDGYMSFRTATPVQHGAYTRQPAADGQMGSILKIYREWQVSGDDQWLRKMWPAVKKALEFAWTYWDRDQDGVMEGEQHNTYDIRWHGPNPMVGSLYLGALRAASEMARHIGDDAAAARYQQLFENGSRKLDQLLWNGEYYMQIEDRPAGGESRWQVGTGCLSDQLVGQWFAELVGLGYLLPAEHVRSALRAIYRYNFRQHMREVPSCGRIYALNDESGLLACSWPRGGRPVQPFGYADEVWTGVEYQVAAHFIMEGMIEEGCRIVRAVRRRHDGRRRNPWDEVECGHHYVRALSSWSLLYAFSGFLYSAPARELRVRPRTTAARFRCIFVTGRAWGIWYQQLRAGSLSACLRVEEGSLEVVCLRLPAHRPRLKVFIEGGPVSALIENGEAIIRMPNVLRLDRGQTLRIELRG